MSLPVVLAHYRSMMIILMPDRQLPELKSCPESPDWNCFNPSQVMLQGVSSNPATLSLCRGILEIAAPLLMWRFSDLGALELYVL